MCISEQSQFAHRQMFQNLRIGVRKCFSQQNLLEIFQVALII